MHELTGTQKYVFEVDAHKYFLILNLVSTTTTTAARTNTTSDGTTTRVAKSRERGSAAPEKRALVARSATHPTSFLFSRAIYIHSLSQLNTRSNKRNSTKIVREVLLTSHIS